MRLRIVLLVITAFAVSASPALATDRLVAKPTDLACGKPTAYVTIQAAVNAANPGDTVKVCPGLYQEQVTIGAGKNNVKLESVKHWQAAIRYPAGLLTDPKAVVLVTQATGVGIKEFTIEGPWQDTSDCSSTRHYGIRVDSGGSAKIESNHITQIQDAISALRGCQDGVAIQVGRQAQSTTGSAEIVHNVIDKFQKNGPTIDGVGSFGKVQENTIDGGGDHNITAKNGVQVGRGASAKVEKNRIFNHYYTGAGPPPASDANDSNDATGILVFNVTGGVTVHENTLYLNDIGFEIYGDATDLGPPTASGVLIDKNVLNSNVFDGLRADPGATGNRFEGNKASSNGSHDCHDDTTGGGTAGTANTWKDNEGNTQTPEGICKRP
jgi:hypothetical protein